MILGSLVMRFANDFTSDFVTRENNWQITSLVTPKWLFTVTHALFFISLVKLTSGDIHGTSLMISQHWCHQATSHCLSQCWPSFMSPYGVTSHNELKLQQLWNTVRCRYNADNFITNIHKRHPMARPLGRGMGCLLWIRHLIDIMSQFLQLLMQNLAILDRVITALDCM